MSVAYVNGSVVTHTGVVSATVVVDGGVIASIGAQREADEVVDVSGCVIMPGFVDLHTHLREPGKEEAETIRTGVELGLVAATRHSWRCRTPTQPRIQ
ncbi:MAG: hypothetical protein ACO3D9_04215 [Ilumatobacteraceae bacterium]